VCPTNLDIKKAGAKLKRELKGRKKLLPGQPWFSARDRVSWVSMRLNIGSLNGDGEVHECEMGTANGEINMDVTTASLLESADGALVIRMYEEVGVANAFGFKEIHQEFNSDGFKPAYVASWDLPRRRETKGCPLITNGYTDTPRGGGIDVETEVS